MPDAGGTRTMHTSGINQAPRQAISVIRGESPHDDGAKGPPYKSGDGEDSPFSPGFARFVILILHLRFSRQNASPPSP